MSTRFDVITVGGGPAGLAAAIAIAETGAATALVARLAPYADNRTTALLGGSVEFLEQLDVWRHCAAASAPLVTMRLVDDTGRLIRAPEVKFSSDEIGMEAFGYNIENRNLMTALEQRAAELPTLTRFDSEAEHLNVDSACGILRTRDGDTIGARLIVGADGRQSLCRTAAGIAVKRETLGQTALTFNVSHSRPHRGVSTEFHTAHGPCVFVPLPGNRSSVVWVASPADAARRKAMSDEALSEAVEQQAHSILGRMQIEPGRHLFPLAIEQPVEIARNRVALVGESAHVLPPIGAQGLNMGLRDAGQIAKLVADARLAGEDPGSPEVLARFETARRSDIASRTWAISMANKSLLSDLLPVQAARALGMHVIGGIGPIRRMAMREGLASSWLDNGRR